MNNPCDPAIRIEWLRWEVSDELAESIAPGLRTDDAGAVQVLMRWLTTDRDRLVNHCLGAVCSAARRAGIEPFTRKEVAHEIDLVAWCHGLR